MNKAAIEAFLAEPHIMILTANRGGREPFVTPIWYEYRADQVLIWTGGDAAKTRLIRRNPAVTLCIQTEIPPYKVVLMRGTAEVRPGADWSLGASIAGRYLGGPEGEAYVAQAKEQPDANPVTLVITPTAWRTWDYGDSAGDSAGWIAAADLR